MDRYVAFAPRAPFGEPNALKRMALLFDRLAIVALSEDLFATSVDPGSREALQQWQDELGFLLEKDVISHAQNEFVQLTGISKSEYAERYNRPFLLTMRDVKWEAARPYWVCRELAARAQEAGAVDAVALVKNADRGRLLKSGPSEVASIILKSLPEPDDLTPWESILEFRSDPDARGAFHRMKRWMNEVAQTGNSAVHIQDEARALLADYEAYLKQHKINAKMGWLETIVCVSVEVLDNVGHLKLGSAVKAVFDIQRYRTQLLEAELQAPGRELAYIYRAQQRYGRANGG